MLSESDSEDRIENCAMCKQQMILTEGTIIFGDKWFHNKCWNNGVIENG
mgnify:CR=1 FL=1